MSDHVNTHAYTRPAARDLYRLPNQVKSDICTIVPILTQNMVEEACSDLLKISDGARVLREAGISQIAQHLYKLKTDDSHAIICSFKKGTCAVLAIQHQDPAE